MLGCGLGEGRRRQDGERKAEDRGAPEIPDHVAPFLWFSRGGKEKFLPCPVVFRTLGRHPLLKGPM
jgi:hypothetical protein